MNCPFCKRFDKRILETERAFALIDKFPVSLGHILVIPKKHTANFFDLSEDVQLETWKLVNTVRTMLQNDLQPTGFNIGINDGKSAGQTVMHAHIHVIPRYDGDVPDPRGGVRWAIPQKAKYWS